MPVAWTGSMRGAGGCTNQGCGPRQHEYWELQSLRQRGGHAGGSGGGAASKSQARTILAPLASAHTCARRSS